MNHYEIVKKLNYWKKKYEKDISILENNINWLKSKIDFLKKKIRKIKQKDFFFKKWEKESQEREKLYHEKWVLCSIVRYIENIPMLFGIGRDIIEGLIKRAKEEHLHLFGFYDNKWSIRI